MSICNRLSLLVLPLFLLCVSPSEGAELSSSETALEENKVETLYGPVFRAKDNNKVKRKCCTGNPGKDGAQGPAGPSVTGPTGPAGPETPAVVGYYTNAAEQIVLDGGFVSFPDATIVSGGFSGSQAGGIQIPVPADGTYQIAVNLFVCNSAGACGAVGHFTVTVETVAQPPVSFVPSASGNVVIDAAFVAVAGDRVEVQYTAPLGTTDIRVLNARVTLTKLGPTPVSA